MAAPIDAKTFESLSFRERDCLRLVLETPNQKEIARRLGLAPSTVYTHLGSAMRKLGVNSSVQAAALFDKWERGEAPQHWGGQSDALPQIEQPLHPGYVAGGWLRNLFRLPAGRQAGEGNPLSGAERMRDSVQAALLAIFALGVAVSGIYGLGWVVWFLLRDHRHI
jgi:DNA-binding CsgD family transcriptional regulator